MVAGYFTRPEDKFDNSYTPPWYKLCCILFTGMLCFLLIFISMAAAADTEPEWYASAEGSMEYNVASLFCYLFDFLCGSLTGIGKSMASILGDNKITENISIPIDDFDKVFNAVVSPMKTIGFALCLFFFIMTLVDLLTSERLSFEIFWKHFLKLILGAFMVDNAEKVKTFVIDFGNAFMKDINTGLGSIKGTNPFAQNEAFMQAVYEFAKDISLGWLIVLGLGFLVGLFPLLLGIIFKGATLLIALSRLLELYLRCAFLPVALALMTDDGWRGAGGRYIKKIIAVAVQGAGLIVIGSLISFACAGALEGIGESVAGQYLLISDLLNNCFTVIFVVAGMGLAGLSLMFKSMGIVNDVFGV